MTMTLALGPGDSIYVTVPIINVTGELPNGLPPKVGPFTYGGRTIALVKGFFVENPQVGYVSLIPEAEKTYAPDEVLTVKYTQILYENNRIFYIAQTGDMAAVNIMTVPMHDHSSIYKGGPAHGTFATDYKDS